jgi:8-oxo-dGTP pyrophosphatase MutT (NUDIX family)
MAFRNVPECLPCQTLTMMDIQTLMALVEGYHEPEDGALSKSRELTLLLLACTPAPFSRHQFTPGHITATGLVFAPDRERLLLVHHRRLDRWLLPGGHVDREDAEIWDSARREVIEETGARLVSVARPCLAGLDVHGIPPKRGEPYHLHHDLIFQFQAFTEDLQVSEESRAVAWCAPGAFDRYDLPLNVRRAYLRVRELSSST